MQLGLSVRRPEEAGWLAHDGLFPPTGALTVSRGGPAERESIGKYPLDPTAILPAAQYTCYFLLRALTENVAFAGAVARVG